MKAIGLSLLALLVTGCSAATVNRIDPVVVVTGVTCPDRYGNPQDLISGFQCCPGGGQCEEDLYCYGVDECRGPLPPNDAYGRARITKRRAF